MEGGSGVETRASVGTNGRRGETQKGKKETTSRVSVCLRAPRVSRGGQPPPRPLTPHPCRAAPPRSDEQAAEKEEVGGKRRRIRGIFFSFLLKNVFFASTSCHCAIAAIARGCDRHRGVAVFEGGMRVGCAQDLCCVCMPHMCTGWGKGEREKFAEEASSGGLGLCRDVVKVCMKGSFQDSLSSFTFAFKDAFLGVG